MKALWLVVVLAVARGDCPPGCACAADDLVRYYCGGLELKTREDGYIEVDCGNKELNCSVLPQLKVGKKPKLERVEVTSCSLAPDVSLACVLRAVGASGASVLAVQKGASGVSERNVAGMDIDALNIIYNGGGYRASSLPVSALSLARVKRSRFVFGEHVTLFANMFANASQLQYLEIGSSGVTEIPADAFSGLSLLSELSLWGNEIVTVAPHAFRGVASLEKLSLDRNPLGSLPPRALAACPRLRSLRLERTALSDLPDGALAGLQQLQEIIISSRAVLTIGPSAFSNLSNLTSLSITDTRVSLPASLSLPPSLSTVTLSGNSISSLSPHLFRSLRNLQTLDLRRNRIQAVSQELFKDLVSVNTIYLDGNLIQELPQQLVSGLTSLRSLHVSDNRLSSLARSAFVGAEHLSLLDLSRNRLAWSDDAAGELDSSPMQVLPELKTLNLSHNNISTVLLDWRAVLPLNELTTLDLSHNAFTELTQADVNILGKPGGPVLRVDFRHNAILRVRHPFWAEPPPKNVLLLLDGNPFLCDCQMYDFLTDIQTGSYKYDVNNAACASPPDLLHHRLPQVSLASLTCELDESPSCLYRPYYHQLECNLEYYDRFADLPDPHEFNLTNMSLRLQTAPKNYDFPEFVSALNLSGLQLEAIGRIPDTVHTLDISNNKLSEIPQRLIRENLTLFIAGNPLACECYAVDALTALTRSKHRVRDFSIALCSDGLPLSGVSPASLCQERRSLAYSLTGTTLLLALAALITAIYIHRLELQVYLYSKRVLLCLLPKEKPDTDKARHVFISLFHGDWELVDKEILPQIEGKYSTLVQERDWVAGAHVLSLIHQSVAESSRTLVVGTSAYLATERCREVLRALHAAAARDRRARAVVLLVGVKKHELDKEIQRLLSLAVVIQYGERMYIEKILYALPRDHLLNQSDTVKIADKMAFKMAGDKMASFKMAAHKMAGLNKMAANKMAPHALQVSLDCKGQLVNHAFVKDVV